MDYQNNSITLYEFLKSCLCQWRWFLLSLAATLGIALVYLHTAQPTFTREAAVMIKESDSHTLGIGSTDGFADLSLQNTPNINNEIALFKSMSLMQQVVQQLDLSTQYEQYSFGSRRVVYGSAAPVRVEFLNPDKTLNSSFKLTASGNAITLTDFCINNIKSDTKAIKCNFGQTVETPVGTIKIERNGAERDCTLKVIRKNLQAAANEFTHRLSVVRYDQSATVVRLILKDKSIERAELILNTLIEQYNNNWLDDKNQIANNSVKFIDSRLSSIKCELDSIDRAISSFKSKNLIPDINSVSNIYLSRSEQSDSELQELNNQLYITRYIADYLRDNEKGLLPVNSGVESNIEAQIVEYNNKILRRNRFIANSSAQNPLVKEIDTELEAIHNIISTSVRTQLHAIENRIKNLNQNNRHNTQRIADNPTQAEYLLAVERQQKVKESLYLYLLQKREENELSKTFSLQNTTLISAPHGEITPTAPHKMSILLLALIAGVLIPASVIYLRKVNNTKLVSKMELQDISIPVIGEIPTVKLNRKNHILVEPNNRNPINESFRVLRTNIAHQAAQYKNEQSNILMITSFDPACGKSFVAINLAVSLAIKGKRVLIIDADLRHATLSDYVGHNKIGLTDYLSLREDTPNVLPTPLMGYENLFVVPVGTESDNSIEFFENERLQTLLDHYRQQFDYILIDCPPMNIIADSLIIEQLADHILIVLRVGVTNKNTIRELENRPNKKDISLIINSVSDLKQRYYYYKA